MLNLKKRYDGLQTYIDLIADNEINIKGQFKTSLINEYII